jgi:hypothetical protein
MINAIIATSGNVTGIYAGSGFSLALLKNGRLTGWGYNEDGQINIPLSTSGNISGVDAGPFHTLALFKDGRITGWGRNWYGQSNIPNSIQYNVEDFSNSASNSYVVLKTSGIITGWGSFFDFQKISFSGVTGFKKVSASYNHGLTLNSGGVASGFGSNTYGQLNVPSAINGKVIGISAGGDHSIALVSGNNGNWVTGWGRNNVGQLNVPASISGKVIDISAGQYHNLAMLSGNGNWVTGWGDNSYGQLNFPTGISGKVAKISAGYTHNLILLTDGSIVAYGDNSLGAVYGMVPTTTTSSSSVFVVYGDAPTDGCDQNLSNFQFNLKGEDGFTPLYNSKHKLLIYKSGLGVGYLPIFEVNYAPYSAGIISTYTGIFDTGNYKTKIRTIYNDNSTMPYYCNAGVQVANLIDISYSNKSGLALFKSNSRILLDTLIRSNSGLNQIATIYFSDDIYTITGHDFTNNTGIFFSGIKTLEPYQKIKEGIAINDALDYAIQNLSWNASKTKIVNIITNNFPYIESDAEPCAEIDPLYAPPIEIKYSTFLNKIASYRSSENLTFNFVYLDKELNYSIDKSKFLYNEKDLKTFYAKAAQIGNGFFGDNDISIVGNSALNASYKLSKIPFCPSVALSSSPSISVPIHCCPAAPTCNNGETLIIDYIKYVENCGFCPNYVCSSTPQNNNLTCGENPTNLNNNDNINLETYFVSHNLKDRLIVWSSGCNNRFDCASINSSNSIDNFVNNLNGSGLTLFDTTCIGTNGDNPPNSIPYNWEKFGNLFKATNNLVFKSGMFPLGILVVPNCNTSTTGTKWFASINGFVSGVNFYTRSFISGDSGVCQQGDSL